MFVLYLKVAWRRSLKEGKLNVTFLVVPQVVHLPSGAFLDTSTSFSASFSLT